MSRDFDKEPETMQKLLILGATGMLGHTLFRELSKDQSMHVTGSARTSVTPPRGIPGQLRHKLITGADATDFESVRRLVRQVRPDVIVNCIGVIKQDPTVRDTARTVTVNSLFPHLLARECLEMGSRLIHVSTDCVFSGSRGAYTEKDIPDPSDFYGRSKLLGEVEEPMLVLRTSIVGHELAGNRSLVDWFLGSSGSVHGFTRAIYSGVTTLEFSRMLRNVIIPRPTLTGLLHVASDPISKHDLLEIIAKQYGWAGDLLRSDTFVCNRSMSAKKLLDQAGYRPPDWPTMVREMYESQQGWGLQARSLPIERDSGRAENMADAETRKI